MVYGGSRPLLMRCGGAFLFLMTRRNIFGEKEKGGGSICLCKYSSGGSTFYLISYIFVFYNIDTNLTVSYFIQQRSHFT